MRCPFLHETRVKSCQASAYRKLIVEPGSDASHERCSSSRYVECAAAVERLRGEPVTEQCPFLRESEAEFCGAASMTKYIPATTALLSRCNSDGHLYCELFLAHDDPAGERRGVAADGSAQHSPAMVEGIAVPPHLSYAPNHMWLDVAADGCRHIGIDALLARVIGVVEKISLAIAPAIRCPVAVLTVNGVAFQMTFPEEMHCTAANYYLRTNPERLIADPYGAGWLFEGFAPQISTARQSGLLSGERAVAWMRDEVERLSRFVHDRLAQPDASGARVMADGGTLQRGLAGDLDREELVNLFNEFFSTQAEWRRSR